MSKIEEQLRTQKAAKEQLEELQPLYVIYMTIQVCAERFAEFNNTKSSFRNFLKNKEASLPPEQVTGAWNAMAEQFKRVEVIMKTYGDIQLYTDCEQTSRYVAGMIMFEPETGGTQGSPLRKKDF
jgi:hypothetical protein